MVFGLHLLDTWTLKSRKSRQRTQIQQREPVVLRSCQATRFLETHKEIGVSPILLVTSSLSAPITDTSLNWQFASELLSNKAIA